MTERTPSDIGENDLRAVLADASADLIFALGSLRLLTILPLYPEAASDAERRVSHALDLIAEAQHLHTERQ